MANFEQSAETLCIESTTVIYERRKYDTVHPSLSGARTRQTVFSHILLTTTPTYSNSTGSQHDETAAQVSRMPRYESHHGFRECLASTRGVADKNHTVGLLRIRVDQLTKILILCQENPMLAEGHIHDNRIVRTGHEFRDCEHIMLCGTERSND